MQLRTTSFFDDPEDCRKKIGMAEYLVRLALGPGDTDDLPAELRPALDRIEEERLPDGRRSR